MQTRDRDETKKRTRLGLRTSDHQQALLRAASMVEGTTMSEFVLRHATRAAEDVLADRRVFMLDPSEWEAFLEALDRPARELPALKKLMETPTILDPA